MEAYDISNSGCVLAVKKFVDAWTTQLHSRGYVSGIYGSAGSMMTNLVQWSTDSTFHQPEGIWYAHWDAVNSTTGDAYIPDTLWPHRRIHQYRGDHNAVSYTHLDVYKRQPSGPSTSTPACARSR